MIAHDRIRLIGLLIFYFKIQMKTKMMYSILAVFPVPNMNKTADFYVRNLGFRCVEYTDSSEPHMCLYKDNIEIILTDSKGKKVVQNRELYGYGYDTYVIVDNQEAFKKSLKLRNLKL